MDIQYLMRQARKLEKARAAADEHMNKATGGVKIPGIAG